MREIKLCYTSIPMLACMILSYIAQPRNAATWHCLELLSKIRHLTSVTWIAGHVSGTVAAGRQQRSLYGQQGRSSASSLQSDRCHRTTDQISTQEMSNGCVAMWTVSQSATLPLTRYDEFLLTRVVFLVEIRVKMGARSTMALLVFWFGRSGRRSRSSLNRPMVMHHCTQLQ